MSTWTRPPWQFKYHTCLAVSPSATGSSLSKSPNMFVEVTPGLQTNPKKIWDFNAKSSSNRLLHRVIAPIRKLQAGIWTWGPFSSVVLHSRILAMVTYQTAFTVPPFSANSENVKTIHFKMCLGPSLFSERTTIPTFALTELTER